MNELKVEVYVGLNETRKIPIQYLERIIESKSSILLYDGEIIGIFAVKYQRQKLQIVGDIRHAISLIIFWMGSIGQKDYYACCGTSFMFTGSTRCIYFSFPEKKVTIAHMDLRIKTKERDNLPKKERPDLTRRAFENENGVFYSEDNILQPFLNVILGENPFFYTKRAILRDKKVKEAHGGYGYESEITLPLDIFFGDFYEQVAEHWRILKKAGFISENWEVLETSKQIVDEMRAKLQNV